MMQSIVWTGRLLSRALWNGIYNYSNCADPSVSRRHESRIVSAVCGFPKELANSRLKKGQFGDDAWFTARYKSADVIGAESYLSQWYVNWHIPRRESNESSVIEEGAESYLSQWYVNWHIPRRESNESSVIEETSFNTPRPNWLMSRYLNDLINGQSQAASCTHQCPPAAGVADGVGGWRHYGIDPGEFSAFLMQTCERLVSNGRFTPTEPASLLARSYYELLENKQPILGSSTACLIVLNRETHMVYTANIGDSGFVIVRHGEVVHRSEEQQHYFNTPFQLSLPPPGHSGLVLSDRPESADTSNFQVEDGDVILLATDGVFDNVPDQLLITELTKLEGERDPIKIQGVANSIALMARSLAFDGNFLSPFAQSARANGIDAIGGKPDDITVLLATVAI